VGKIESTVNVEEVVNKAKGEVCKEFEKVCVTDMSFKRMKKEMHNIFDQLAKDIDNVTKW
jgi:ribosome recycling factor